LRNWGIVKLGSEICGCGFGELEMGKWRNGEMEKWRNEEMRKWN
jgi:hypothetical protein